MKLAIEDAVITATWIGYNKYYESDKLTVGKIDEDYWFSLHDLGYSE